MLGAQAVDDFKSNPALKPALPRDSEHPNAFQNCTRAPPFVLCKQNTKAQGQLVCLKLNMLSPRWNVLHRKTIPLVTSEIVQLGSLELRLRSMRI